MPVTRLAMTMRHGNDDYPTRFDAIDNAERKAPKEIPSGAVIELRICVGQSRDCGLRRVDLFAER